MFGVRVDVYHHLGDDNVSELERLVNLLLKQGESFMATQEEVVQVLNAANEKLTKVGTEIVSLKDEVQALKDALAQMPNASPELVAAAEAVAQRVQGLDDLNVDPVDPDNPS